MIPDCKNPTNSCQLNWWERNGGGRCERKKEGREGGEWRKERKRKEEKGRRKRKDEEGPVKEERQSRRKYRIQEQLKIYHKPWCGILRFMSINALCVVPASLRCCRELASLRCCCNLVRTWKRVWYVFSFLLCTTHKKNVIITKRRIYQGNLLMNELIKNILSFNFLMCFDLRGERESTITTPSDHINFIEATMW